MPSSTCFPTDYAATQAPLAALSDGLGELRAHAMPHTGPGGEALYSHSLWHGPATASRVLVVLSGTHGVEGLAGAGIQLDLLARLQRGDVRLPPDCALLLVYLLNPWGCAWLRRCDADGVDLNRNAVDFSQPLPVNPGYDALRPWLLSDDADARHRVLSAYEAEHGRVALDVAVSGGQYSDPTGPFYGGQAPAPGLQLVKALMAEHDLSRRQLAVIDLHTGLGPYGYGEIICDHAPDSAGTRTAQRWYGDAVTLPLAGTSSSVPKTGLLDYAWHDIMGPDSCFVTLEFGTFATNQLFDVLLQDHRLHAPGLPGWQNAATVSVKQAMRAHFCPQASQWQALVLFQARQVIDLALAGLGASPYQKEDCEKQGSDGKAPPQGVAP